MKGAKILITGGVNSGKSDHALQIGDSFPGDKIFVATAQPLDENMRSRIEKHRLGRAAHWRTIEEPLDPASVLNGGKTGVFLLDCLTVWTNNLLETKGDDGFRCEAARLASAVEGCEGTVIMVTNEVGFGIIPADERTRTYGEMLGMLNRRIASVCDRVILLVAGLPIIIKGG